MVDKIQNKFDLENRMKIFLKVGLVILHLKKKCTHIPLKLPLNPYCPPQTINCVNIPLLKLKKKISMSL
jgi:hypothetical protein